jgi:hypothetical protein
MEEYTKLTGKEINKLKPGDWVAWRKERWKPICWDTKWVEAQLTNYPIRCHQVVFVRFRGIRTPIEKNRLYKPPPVVGIDAIHEVLDYDS